MPYIKQERRKVLQSESPTNLFHYGACEPQDSGELNYIITKIIQGYILDHGQSYQTYNDIMGALEGAKLEFYRKIVAVYEDKKEIENGTVWD